MNLIVVSVIVVVTAQDVVHNPCTPRHHIVMLVLQLIQSVLLLNNLFNYNINICIYHLLNYNILNHYLNICLNQVHDLGDGPDLGHHITGLIINIRCEIVHLPCVPLLISCLTLSAHIVAIILKRLRGFDQLDRLEHNLIGIVPHFRAGL